MKGCGHYCCFLSVQFVNCARKVKNRPVVNEVSLLQYHPPLCFPLPLDPSLSSLHFSLSPTTGAGRGGGSQEETKAV